ncbi:hypothetical protein [Sphingomonas sp. R86521]|uniref:hypothetical protein n=1 Tax=Sphingomonas sp. R86521 TaxID=3093860 RepID=UPI0036D30305
MPNDISESDTPNPANRNRSGDNTPPQPFLRVRPKHFFSNKFDMEIVEDYSKAELEERPDDSQKWLGRLIDMNLFLLIVVVGVPVLVYCIMASST